MVVAVFVVVGIRHVHIHVREVDPKVLELGMGSETQHIQEQNNPENDIARRRHRMHVVVVVQVVVKIQNFDLVEHVVVRRNCRRCAVCRARGRSRQIVRNFQCGPIQWQRERVQPCPTLVPNDSQRHGRLPRGHGPDY